MRAACFSLKNPKRIFPTIWFSPMWAFLCDYLYLVLRQLTRKSELFLISVCESLAYIAFTFIDTDLLILNSGLSSASLFFSSKKKVFRLNWHVFLGEKAGKFVAVIALFGIWFNFDRCNAASSNLIMVTPHLLFDNLSSSWYLFLFVAGISNCG